MDEPLGVAANVVTVIQISEKIVSACCNYFTIAKHAKADILAVLNGVSGLKNVLEHLHSLIDTDSKSQAIQFPQLSSVNEPLKMCQAALENLGSKLGIKVEKNSGRVDITVNLPNKLKWPWQRADIEKILQIIKSHMTMFILVLSGNTLRTTLQIEDSVAQISTSPQHTSASKYNIDEVYITGGQDRFVYRSFLGADGYGEVHMVSSQSEID